MRFFRTFSLLGLLLAPGAAWAQCAGGLIVNCPAAVNPQPTDTLQLWQPGQTPHMRKVPLSSLPSSGIASVTAGTGLTGGGTSGNVTLSLAPVTANSITNTLPTWMGYLSGTANPNPIKLAQPGVFTNTATVDPLIISINGGNPITEFQWSHPGLFSTEGAGIAMVVPGTANGYSANAFGAYVNNGATRTQLTGGAIGSYSYIRNSVAGALSFATNFLASDGGFLGTVVGSEYDIGVKAAGSTALGINMVGVFEATPVSAVAYQVSSLNGPWSAAFATGDGSANIGFLIGSLTTTANSDSQSIVFDARDASNTSRQCSVAAQHTTSGANVAVTCPTGGGLVVAGNLLASGSTALSGSLAVTGITALGNVLELKSFTVATLPACSGTTINAVATVSDATSPTYNGTLTGGGTGAAAHVPVYCNGTSWVSH